ncbi:MAG: ROK family protein, partial [Phaeodactylibacter sp.]|nr:ROK family protein [Phaeodactylibacter sp.]
MRPLWGIDLGGTKIEGIILKGPPPFNVLSRIRIPTEAEKGYAHIVQQVGRVVGLLKEESGLWPERL